MIEERGVAKGTMAQDGAILWAIWGILHVWVGYEGVHQYMSAGVRGQWSTLVGGARVPRETFDYATDAATAFAHSQLILNFCLDVGGYGVLGLFIAWMIWAHASWMAYLIGLVAIGIGDLSFLFALVTSGVIEFSFAVILGPLVWFIAVVVTPFGLPRLWSSRRT
ncbi:MAG: hypothetical protein EXR45_05625 [Chloroflexi bacterium]|nr:hypothetical protein [Chloroflexota bacterium]